jgi:phosphate transport system protein
MPRETLDRQIHTLLDQVLVLGSMVETTTLEAIDALKRQDLRAAERIYNKDHEINARRFEMENATVTTIATQQPIMAGDLRLLSSLLEIITEIERMGDYAKGIARICLIIGNEPFIKPLIDIPRMADLAVDMLHRALGAFVTGDVETARAIPEEDNLVDQLYQNIYRELVGIMTHNPSTIDQANYLMWAAHNLERFADRVSNICERTVYWKTGTLAEFRSTDDELVQGRIAPQ